MRGRWRCLAGLGVMWGAVSGTLLADDVHWDKPYDYEVRLDNRPEAQGQDFAHYHYVTAGEFCAFRGWSTDGRRALKRTGY